MEAKKQVDKCKAKDDRFFIVQLFSESEDVIQAKRRQDVAEKELEQAIFRMVLRGIDSAQAISELLWIFSDYVKATAIQKLVNHQVLRAELRSNRLFLSDGIISIIEACRDCTYAVELPEILLPEMTDGGLLVENRQVIMSILNHMLPGVSIDFLASELSFRVTKVRCGYET